MAGSTLLTQVLRELITTASQKRESAGDEQAHAMRRLGRGLGLRYTEDADGNTGTLSLSRQGGASPSRQEVDTVLASLDALGWPYDVESISYGTTVHDKHGIEHTVVRISLQWLETSF